MARIRIFRDAWYAAFCGQDVSVMNKKMFKKNLILLNCDIDNKQVRDLLKNRLLSKNSNSTTKKSPKNQAQQLISRAQFFDNVNEIQTAKQKCILDYLLKEYKVELLPDDLIDEPALRIFLAKINFDQDLDPYEASNQKLVNSSWMYGENNSSMWNNFISDHFDAVKNGGITQRSVLNFLFSDENSILDPRIMYNNDGYGNPMDDYKYSICDYYINSSHNTYLVSDQLWGLSSLEAYAHSLRMGCRCVEIDCWDGDDKVATLQSRAINQDEPIVLHGYTCTSTLLFKDVMRVVARHAFETSDLPVILSIENHCRPYMQSKMAFYMKSILGEMLLVEEADPIQRDGLRYDRLPMLCNLKNKVIIKFKKLAEKNRNTCDLIESWNKKNGRNHRENIRSIVGDNMSIYSEMEFEKYQWITSGRAASSLVEENEMSKINFEKLCELNFTAEKDGLNELDYEDANAKEFSDDDTQSEKDLQAQIALSMCTKKDLKELGTQAKNMQEKLKPPDPGTLKRSKSADSLATGTVSQTDSMYNMDASLAMLIFRNGNDDGMKDDKIAKDLSDVVVYCIGGHFKKLAAYKNNKIDVRQMCSVAYNALMSYKSENNKKKLINYTANRFLRNYPPGLHFFSANYNPIDCWNIGAHMVALNFQCSDFFLTLSHAQFMHSYLGFGYVRKPDVLIHPVKGLQPKYLGQITDDGRTIIKYEIQLLGARNVARHIEIDGLSFPSVKFEIHSSNGEYYCKTYQGTDPGGLALTFSKPKVIYETVANNDFAYLYIELSETGIYGTKVRLGQCTLRLNYLRTGVRSIPLCDRYNQAHPCATLLVSVQKFEIKKFTRKQSVVFWEKSIKKINEKTGEILDLTNEEKAEKVNSYVEDWVRAIKKKHAEKEADFKKAGITMDDTNVAYNLK